ncbi:putative uridine nucleosidase 2 [Symbiodinium microadriaticum]|uniref:Putative uridine nucleosidase 2 n=1 Tax=Symbiodinium microadriaticum TaxID=2951 RepID=A0A1Q9C2Z7_SYMMI|nr:putative uridine nucleosidase 2 [Symbiodinium microadriaticum]
MFEAFKQREGILYVAPLIKPGDRVFGPEEGMPTSIAQILVESDDGAAAARDFALAVERQVIGPEPLCFTVASARRIVIDTDPGVDDALAILLASGSPELKLEGSNAKLLLRLAGLAETPVALGAQPDLNDGEAGAMVSREGAKYGKDASDRTGFHELAAPEFIYEICKGHMQPVLFAHLLVSLVRYLARNPREITLVCIGPLHNLAAALDSHPDLPQLLCEVVIMGGAFGERRGNRTPSAEANFFDGPEAAQARRGLDITHQTDMLVLRKACLESGSALSQFVWELCENFINVYHAALPVRFATIAVMMVGDTRDWGETLAPAHDADFVVRLSGALRELSESGKVRWKDGDFASAVEDLQEQDSQLMEELQRVAGESEELRKKSEPPGKLGSLWSWSSDVLLQIPTLYCRKRKASTVPSAASVRPKLQDLAQHRSRRFAEELEFVQCLANPSYVLLETAAIWSLHADLRCRNVPTLTGVGFKAACTVCYCSDHLPGVPGDAGSSAGSSGLPLSMSDDKAFGDPFCSRFEVKEASAVRAQTSSFLIDTSMDQVRLSPEADLAGIEAVEDPIIDEPAPKSELLRPFYAVGSELSGLMLRTACVDWRICDTDPSDGAKVDLAEVSRRPPLDPVPSKVAPSAAECSREREVDPQASRHKAILLQPSRAAAHLNLTYSYIKIRDRANAVRAIVQDLAKVLASKRGTSNRFGASRGKSRPSSGSGKQPRRRPPATRQMMSRLEAWQMRKDLAALRSNDTAEETVAPWGRRHIYSEDSEQAISSKKAPAANAARALQP